MVKTENALEQINYLQDLINQTRSRAVEGYPHLLVWGALWVIGYLSTIWLSHAVWMIIGAVGGVSSLVICGLDLRKAHPVPLFLKKLGWLCLILVVYFGLLFCYLCQVTINPQLIISYWPFHIGLLYIIAGIFIGRQLIYIGGWLILVAVAGCWLPVTIQLVWLAVSGGGGLILTGIIFRKYARRAVESNDV